MPDNRTLVQTQPAYRCEAGGPLLSRYHSGTSGVVVTGLPVDGGPLPVLPPRRTAALPVGD